MLTGRVILGDHQFRSRDRHPPDPFPEPRPPALLPDVGADAGRCGEHHHARVIGVDETQAGDLIADQFRRAQDDRVENLVQGTSGGDRALDPREAFQEHLTLANGHEQGTVLEGLILTGHPLLPFLQQGPSGPQGQREDPGESADQAAFLMGESAVADASDEQPPTRHAVAVDRDHGALARTWHAKPGTAFPRRGDELALRDRASGISDTRHDRVAGDGGPHVGFQRLHRVLHRPLDDIGVVREGADQRQQLGQLLCRPACPAVDAHPTARTTRVWLWNPPAGECRAISP